MTQLPRHLLPRSGPRRALPMLLLAPLLGACANAEVRGPEAGVVDAGAPPPPPPPPPTGTRDPDLDDDGVADHAELALGTDPAHEDTDRDGWLDGVEVLAGTDPLSPGEGPGPEALQVVLAPKTPRTVALPFAVRLGQADVFFLVDGTGSMAAVIDGVRATLRDRIVPGLLRVLSAPRLGLGVVRDFPRDGHGAPSDQPFVLGARLSFRTDALRAALGELEARGGGDVPEALVEALGHAVAAPCRPAARTEAGGYGAACFRPAALPIVVLLTDAPSHNGPDGDHPYGFDARGYSEVTGALRRRGVRVLGVATAPDARGHLTALARATGALTADGRPLVYEGGPDGEVDQAIVRAVEDLAASVEVDVVLDFPSPGLGPGDDRGRAWLTRVESLGTDPPARRRDDRRFLGVRGGATGSFAATFAAPPRDTAGGRACVRAIRIRASAWPRGDVLSERLVFLVARPDPPVPLG